MAAVSLGPHEGNFVTLLVLFFWVSMSMYITFRYLEYCLDPKMIRKQDASRIIVYIAGNPVGQSLAWDFIRANWNLIFNE